MLEYLKYAKCFFYKRYPAEITFFVTSRCNFDCAYCFNAAKRSTGAADELSPDEIERLSRTIPPFLRLSISGGEPFLRGDLARICASFHNNARVKFITIPTNASLPERTAAQVEEIARACPQLSLHISLSVDALGGERDRIVGRGGSFSNLIETAKGIRRLQARYAKLTLGTITTQIPANETRLEDIRRFCTGELGVDNFAFNVARQSPANISEPAPDLNIYEEFTKKIISEKAPSRFKFPLSHIYAAKKHLVFREVSRARREGRFLIPCFSGSLRLVIDETGNLFPCETLQYRPDSGRFLMGNLREAGLDFRKAFFSPKAAEVKRFIKESRCFCAHECDLETNILFNPCFTPALLAEAARVFLCRKRSTPSS